jgi:hypothetical protein
MAWTWPWAPATAAARRGHVERALEWLDEYGDSDGDGYLEYESASKKGLINQGCLRLSSDQL